MTFLPGMCVQLWAGEFTAAHHETPAAPWWLTGRNTFPNLPGESWAQKEVPSPPPPPPPCTFSLTMLKIFFLKHFNLRATSIYSPSLCPDNNFPLRPECFRQVEPTARRDFSLCKALSNLTCLSQSLKSIAVVSRCLYPKDFHLSFFMSADIIRAVPLSHESPSGPWWCYT